MKYQTIVSKRNSSSFWVNCRIMAVVLSYAVRNNIVTLVLRHPELLADDLVTWEPEARRGETKRGRPRQSYLSTLLRDVGINTKEELRTLMRDRDMWRKISAVDWT